MGLTMRRWTALQVGIAVYILLLLFDRSFLTVLLILRRSFFVPREQVHTSRSPQKLRRSSCRLSDIFFVGHSKQLLCGGSESRACRGCHRFVAYHVLRMCGLLVHPLACASLAALLHAHSHHLQLRLGYRRPSSRPCNRPSAFHLANQLSQLKSAP